MDFLASWVLFKEYVTLATPDTRFLHAMDILRRNSPQGDGTELVRDIWALTGVAVVILGLRIAAKLRIAKFGPDDLLMVFALVSRSLLFLPSHS